MTGRRLRSAVLAVLPSDALAGAVRRVYPRVEPELAALGEFMPRGGVALDVGAWLGPWSRKMRRYADRVVAVEAHPDLADRLRRSVPGVTVVHGAASDTPGSLTLAVPPAGPMLGVSSVAGSPEAGSHEVVVPAVVIDDLELTDVRFIKMDIEGHELVALRGAEATVRRDRPYILVELEERLQPVAPVVELLGSWGYTGYVRPGHRWVPLAGFDLVGHQRGAIRRVSQSFVRRLVWPRPRYVNMVLFRPTPG